jgi:hypothetical protein
VWYLGGNLSKKSIAFSYEATCGDYYEVWCNQHV